MTEAILKPQAAVEKIDLAKANNLIATADRTKIRNIRARMVEQYARDMLAGDWVINGSTIGINQLGRMVDGNHRMRALKMAAEKGVGRYPAQPDINVEFLVVRGIKADASVEDTIDTGKSRLYRDVLAIRGMSNVTMLASVTRRLRAWDEGIYYTGTGSEGRPPSFSELDDFFQKHQDEITAAVDFSVQWYRGSRLTPSTMCIAYIILHRVDVTEKVDEFLKLLARGGPSVSPEINPAILALRERLDRMDWTEGRDKNSKLSQANRLALVFLAWNQWKLGTGTSSRLTLPRGGLSNKNFPLPKGKYAVR